MKYSPHRGRCAVLAAGTVVFCSVAPLFAQDYKASLAQMPVYAESVDKGVLVDLVKAIAKASGKKIDYQVVPFNRSMEDVIGSRVDFHMPLIVNPNIPEKDLNYYNSTETIFHVNFTLFTNKNKPVDLKDADKLLLETDAAHVRYFPFKISPSSSLEGSIKNVNVGRIDGFIFADFAIDPLIKANNLTNVKRTLYKVFDVKIILPKTEKGKATDAFLTTTIKKMRDSGEFKKIMSVIDTPFDGWQP